MNIQVVIIKLHDINTKNRACKTEELTPQVTSEAESRVIKSELTMSCSTVTQLKNIAYLRNISYL